MPVLATLTTLTAERCDRIKAQIADIENNRLFHILYWNFIHIVGIYFEILNFSLFTINYTKK